MKDSAEPRSQRPGSLATTDYSVCPQLALQPPGAFISPTRREAQGRVLPTSQVLSPRLSKDVKDPQPPAVT